MYKLNSGHHTSCKNCIFAVYENSTQNSCFLGVIDRIQNMENTSLRIIEAYDQEKEFYIVNNSKCLHYSEDLKNKTIEERADEVKEKSILKYVLLINAKPTMSLEEIEDILNKIKENPIKPKGILLVIYPEEHSKKQNEEYLAVIRRCGIDCEWRITKVLDNDQPYVLTLHQQAMSFADQRFTLLCVNGKYSKINELVELGNDLVFNQFKSFGMISNQSKDTILFNSSIYREAISHGIDILEKPDYII